MQRKLTLALFSFLLLVDSSDSGVGSSSNYNNTGLGLHAEENEFLLNNYMVWVLSTISQLIKPKFVPIISLIIQSVLFHSDYSNSKNVLYICTVNFMVYYSILQNLNL